MKQVDGCRVGSRDDIEDAGDYAVVYGDDGRTIACLWFCMPGFVSHKWNRIPGPGSENEKSKAWEISEDAAGVVTVSPSILSHWNEGSEQRRFHAFLKQGVWEVLDDTEGAIW